MSAKCINVNVNVNLTKACLYDEEGEWRGDKHLQS